MKLTEAQIDWLLIHTGSIEIDHNDYDKLNHWADRKADDDVAWEASFEHEGLIYEETITLGDLRTAEIEDDTLVLQDSRELRFKWTKVIPWEAMNDEN